MPEWIFGGLLILSLHGNLVGYAVNGCCWIVIATKGQGVPLREYGKDARNEKSDGFVNSFGNATNCVQTATTTIKTGLCVNDGRQLKEGKNNSLIGRRERSKPNAASDPQELNSMGVFRWYANPQRLR